MSYYNLTDVVQKIREHKFVINPNAIKCAYQDFGWGKDEIVAALKNLRAKHFLRTIPFRTKQGNVVDGVMVDHYGGIINQEDIYTHFYIEDDFLVINSFKRNTPLPIQVIR